MTDAVVLGVDVGTTATKTTAFRPDGSAVGASEHGYPLRLAAGGRAEQDPRPVVEAVLRTVRAAAAAARESGADVEGVAVSAAMHGLCGVGDDGRPRTPILTWADTRARAQADALRARDPGAHDRTGTPVHPMAPSAKLRWFREEDPDGFAAVRRWVGVKELVLHALTGRWVLDVSCASGTGLWNARGRDWDEDVLRWAGVGPELLAPVVAVDHVVGGLTAHTASAVALPADTPVVAGAGDGPLANVGVGALRPGVAACSIGTSAALRLTVDRPDVDPDRRLFAYALDATRWVTGGAITDGGAVLRWVADALAPDLGPGAEAELLALAERVPVGSDGLVLLPSLLAARAPRWTGDARGAFVGLTAAHGRGHLVRAAVEGVCLQLALVLASLRDAGHRVDEVRATGGFARSPFWRGLLADVLGVPVGFPERHDGSGLGAALVGMGALGLVAPDRPPDEVALAEVRRPDPGAADRYAELLPVYASLGAAIGPGLRALDRLADRD